MGVKTNDTLKYKRTLVPRTPYILHRKKPSYWFEDDLWSSANVQYDFGVHIFTPGTKLGSKTKLFYKHSCFKTLKSDVVAKSFLEIAWWCSVECTNISPLAKICSNNIYGIDYIQIYGRT